MATVREVLKAKLERLRDKKARIVAEAQIVQGDIDALKGELDTITPTDEARFARLQALAVIKAED